MKQASHTANRDESGSPAAHRPLSPRAAAQVVVYPAPYFFLRNGTTAVKCMANTPYPLDEETRRHVTMGVASIVGVPHLAGQADGRGA